MNHFDHNNYWIYDTTLKTIKIDNEYIIRESEYNKHHNKMLIEKSS